MKLLYDYIEIILHNMQVIIKELIFSPVEVFFGGGFNRYVKIAVDTVSLGKSDWMLLETIKIKKNKILLCSTKTFC